VLYRVTVSGLILYVCYMWIFFTITKSAKNIQFIYVMAVMIKNKLPRCTMFGIV